MANYLAGIWRCRYFWLSLVKMDLRTRYRRSVLGMGWSLLHPIAMTIILCIVFTGLMSPEKGVAFYGPYLLAGLATWEYIRNTVLHGCQCFYLGESYIRQYPAPLAIYPLRTALGGTIHFLIALVVVVLLAVGLRFLAAGSLAPENTIGLRALPSLLPSVLIVFVFVWSTAVLSGCANVYFQDTQHLCEVGFQILFYATPIIYEKETLQQRGLGWLIDCNPLVSFLDLFRYPIIFRSVPPLTSYGIALALTLVMGAAASFTLFRCQRRLIFHL
jgi:ABC-type polysaccharide/polyol phosphate export permease